MDKTFLPCSHWIWIHLLPTKQAQPNVLWRLSWFFPYILIIQKLNLFLPLLPEIMFSTLFKVASIYFSFQWVLCHFSVAQRVPLQSHEHTIYQIINSKHVSKPAISFPNHIFRIDEETASSWEITAWQDFRGWFGTTAKYISKINCYVKYQNRMRIRSSSPVLFWPLILSFSYSLFLCADFFLVEISVESTFFENDVTFLLLRESSLQNPSVTDKFEQIQVERRKQKSIWENKKAQETDWQFSL